MKRSILRESTVWLLVLLGGVWGLTHLAGCNTVEGMGEDVEDVGEGVSSAARGADDAN
ncbi:MAG: entericidin A/B family lipoprotein [Phycisphaerales bacterium]|nr:entericidin A/B family lipoprotein [Phycisphaerales bacterium]MCI0630097.1 entericidin A/B family lipoprotein [Phycisphaerales bacterium]MCI0677223.1 entericidin A/B family lipoprotein [Phycisphaerales bacterium]